MIRDAAYGIEAIRGDCSIETFAREASYDELMRAIVYHEYGSPDVLKCEDVEKPTPKNDEVLIKVRAASVNPLDWRLMRGEPRMLRIVPRLLKMPIGRPGVDVAGEVEAVGSKVTQFKPGDRIFGGARGAFAEYTTTREKSIVTKPDSVTFEQAASIYVAGLTAVQGLRDHGKIQPGSNVLINGAAGGVGTFAVQIAKALGAHVTGVCSTRNLDMVRSIGADEVIDYTQSDFAGSDKRYDLILDCVGNHSFSECKRVLTPKGRFIGIGAPHEFSLLSLLVPAIRDVLFSRFSSQKAVMFMAKASQADLTFIGELIATGRLKPVIDHTYPLIETRAAVWHVEEGHARGKVIVDLDRASEM